MKHQNGIDDILYLNNRIPVVTFNNINQVAPVLTQLEAASVSCIEITLRTEIAWEAIEYCKKNAKEGFKVGVGTIINTNQIARCESLNVDFMVSPGLSPILVDSLQSSGIPFLPGVMTPSEIIMALDKDCTFLKLFPYNLAGGVKALTTYASVFQDVKFCPTGGLNEENYQEVLALKNVVSVGGSWLCDV